MNEEAPITSSAVDLNKISLTVKSTVAAILPIAHLLFGVTIVGEQADKVIDAVFVLVSASLALYGYIRSKRAMQNQIIALGGTLGATKDYARRSRR